MSANILTRSYEPAFPPAWEGLCLASAEECTPRLYGVSFGDGNNGVSHMYADYYVRTADPFLLAAVAQLASFNDAWKTAAAEAIEIDGEAEFTISATVYNPVDQPDSDWCDSNGAWSICEVFPDSDPRPGALVYDSMEEAFSAEDLAQAANV